MELPRPLGLRSGFTGRTAGRPNYFCSPSIEFLDVVENTPRAYFTKGRPATKARKFGKSTGRAFETVALLKVCRRFGALDAWWEP